MQPPCREQLVITTTSNFQAPVVHSWSGSATAGNCETKTNLDFPKRRLRFCANEPKLYENKE